MSTRERIYRFAQQLPQHDRWNLSFDDSDSYDHTGTGHGNSSFERHVSIPSLTMQYQPTDPSAKYPAAILRVVRTTKTGAAAVYAIDWGDGSAPEVLVKRLNSTTDYTRVRFSHHYSNAGKFTDRIGALTSGGLDDYAGTVSVVAAHASTTQKFEVPRPPRQAKPFPPKHRHRRRVTKSPVFPASSFGPAVASPRRNRAGGIF